MEMEMMWDYLYLPNPSQISAQITQIIFIIVLFQTWMSFALGQQICKVQLSSHVIQQIGLMLIAMWSAQQIGV